jgi:hypothetical protein
MQEADTTGGLAFPGFEVPAPRYHLVYCGDFVKEFHLCLVWHTDDCGKLPEVVAARAAQIRGCVAVRIRMFLLPLLWGLEGMLNPVHTFENRVYKTCSVEWLFPRRSSHRNVNLITDPCLPPTLKRALRHLAPTLNMCVGWLLSWLPSRSLALSFSTVQGQYKLLLYTDFLSSYMFRFCISTITRLA